MYILNIIGSHNMQAYDYIVSIVRTKWKQPYTDIDVTCSNYSLSFIVYNSDSVEAIAIIFYRKRNGCL